MGYKYHGIPDVLAVDGSLVSRTCRNCKLEKSAREFHFAGNRKYQRRTCKKCTEEEKKVRTEGDRGHYAELARTRHLRRTYGLSDKEFLKLLEIQEGLCSICWVELDTEYGTQSPNKVQVDHCHETDVVRGLLCFSCNTGLGKFRDSKELLQRALNYLNNPPDVVYRATGLTPEELKVARLDKRKKQLPQDLSEVPKVTRAQLRGFTPQEKDQIRQEYRTENVSQTYLAERWSTHCATVSIIVNT